MPAAQPSWNGPLGSRARVCASCWWPRETWRRSSDPEGLTALGFVGISDPLRPGAAAAVRRCREAGVRVVMLTGDHPATAKAIARNAGLPTGDSRVLTGEEVAELDEADLAGRLECATVIARTTPL